MDDIQELLDEIEDELHQELEVTEESRDKAQQAVKKYLTISISVRRFHKRYRDGNDEKRQELFDDWRLKFLSRARNDHVANKIHDRLNLTPQRADETKLLP